MYDKIIKEEIKEGKRALLSDWKMTDLLFTEGKGATFKDIDGKEYIDCTSQAWSLVLGFNHPRVIKAVEEQLRRFTHVRSTFYTIPQLLLAKKLSEIAPGKESSKLNRAGFLLHGSLAIEEAMKIAMKCKPGAKFLSLYNGYHGRSLATMAVSWPHSKNDFFPYMENVLRVPAAYCYRCSFGLSYPSCNLQCAQFMDEAIEKMTGGEIAGLIMEPIQGNGGQIIFPKEYYKKVREICDKYNILLIWDEIQTAFGRLPRMFAAEYFDVTPDIIVFGKGIAGGFPLAGTLSRRNLPAFIPGDHGFTFAHFPLSLVAALETIKVIEEEHLLERSEKLGNYIVSRLNSMKENYEVIGDVRGCGLMIGVELIKDRKTKEPARKETHKIEEEAMKQGVLFGTSLYRGLGNVLKIKPPVVITEKQIDRALEVFEESLKKVFYK